MRMTGESVDPFFLLICLICVWAALTRFVIVSEKLHTTTASLSDRQIHSSKHERRVAACRWRRRRGCWWI